MLLVGRILIDSWAVSSDLRHSGAPSNTPLSSDSQGADPSMGPELTFQVAIRIGLG
jgi:hypothetical protein